jgi:hypothetical protein
VAKNTFSKYRDEVQYAEPARKLSPELKNVIRQTLVPMLVKRYIQSLKSSSPDLGGGKK